MTSSEHKPHSSLDEAKRQAIRILAGGPVLYPQEYALVAREFLGLVEQFESVQRAFIVWVQDPTDPENIALLTERFDAVLYPAKSPDSYEVVDHTEAREDYHKEYME